MLDNLGGSPLFLFFIEMLASPEERGMLQELDENGVDSEVLDIYCDYLKEQGRLLGAKILKTAKTDKLIAEALQKSVDQQEERLEMFRQGAITRNELRSYMGLGPYPPEASAGG